MIVANLLRRWTGEPDMILLVDEVMDFGGTVARNTVYSSLWRL